MAESRPEEIRSSLGRAEVGPHLPLGTGFSDYSTVSGTLINWLFPGVSLLLHWWLNPSRATHRVHTRIESRGGGMGRLCLLLERTLEDGHLEHPDGHYGGQSHPAEEPTRTKKSKWR